MAKTSGNPARKSHRKDPVVRAAFARIIVDLRRKLKLKQRQVADRSGYSEKYIGNLERRLNTPSLTAAIEIASALRVDPTDVLAQTLSLMPSFKHLERKDPLTADM
jgi:transcriptional regulator with XRE-family HTH domain